jgi:hypothetical protein
MNYLGALKSAMGSTHLLAHSMGNIVAAEALRQWAANGHGDALVNTYVAMQGAISAGAYGSNDNSAGVGDSETDLYRHWPIGIGADYDGYFYMAGSQNAAGTWVNMFNPVDAATAGVNVLGTGFRLAWPSNNWAKGGLTQGTVWNWHYAWSSSQGYRRGWLLPVPPWDPTFIAEAYLNDGLTVPDANAEQFEIGPSAYESMAFLAKSEAMPIGTMDMVTVPGFFAANLDINDLGLSVAFARSWAGHSFQVNFDAATATKFWKEIQIQTGFRTTLAELN